MGVKTFGRSNTRVTKLLGYGDDICTICQEDRSHSVAECVGIDVWQTVAVGKVMQPACNAVRTHVVAIVLSKHIICPEPSVSVIIKQRM